MTFAQDPPEGQNSACFGADRRPGGSLGHGHPGCALTPPQPWLMSQFSLVHHKVLGILPKPAQWKAKLPFPRRAVQEVTGRWDGIFPG